MGAFAGRGQRASACGAVLLAAYDPDAELYRTVTKCGTGFSDADLASLPGRLVPLARAEKPARVDARQQPDFWFEPGVVIEVLSAELTLSPHYSAGWGVIKEDAERPCGPAFYRTLARRQGRDRVTITASWSTCTAPRSGCRSSRKPRGRGAVWTEERSDEEDGALKRPGGKRAERAEPGFGQLGEGGQDQVGAAVARVAGQQRIGVAGAAWPTTTR